MDIEESGAEQQQQQPAAAAAAGLSEQDAKRLRKLEQNRLAAQLSRQRKKQRTEELQKHIIELQQQNQELQQATTKLYGLLVAESGKDVLALIDELHAENSTLKYTLFQRLQALLYTPDHLYVQHPSMFFRPLSAGPGGSRPDTPADDNKDSRGRGGNGTY